MIRFLFPRLTERGDAPRGRALFDLCVREARQPHWFMTGGVDDSLDGRFAVLATVISLAIVRLERGSAEAVAASVALTERFVEAMDAEHRQLGVGDPALGKKVRKLVGSLERRVGVWRDAVADETTWARAADASLFPAGAPGPAESAQSAAAAGRLWARLEAVGDEELIQGDLQ